MRILSLTVAITLLLCFANHVIRANTLRARAANAFFSQPLPAHLEEDPDAVEGNVKPVPQPFVTMAGDVQTMDELP